MNDTLHREGAGLYIHIPFCVRKCPYCDFYSITDLNRIPEFVDALVREMALRRPPEQVFDTVYIGGGTPTVLSASQVCRIMEAAARAFSIAPDPEITIEANPGTLTASLLKDLHDAGINRINLGVQSFDDANLKFLGRIHNGVDARKALEMAEAAGFDNIGLDLIYALPDQRLENWQRDLATAVDFSPAHLSCYMLTCESGTPLDAARLAGRFVPANESRQAAFFLKARQYLLSHGYEHYEISNYARSPRFRSRHNTKYWNDFAYLGLGPGAHSYDPPERTRNVRSVGEYLERIGKGKLPVEETEILDSGQQMIEAIYLGLRQTDGIDCRVFERRFAVDFQQRFSEPIQKLEEQGYLWGHGRRIGLTEQGLLVQESIAEAFIDLV